MRKSHQNRNTGKEAKDVQQAAILTLIVFFSLVSVCAYCSIRRAARINRERIRHSRATQQLALELSPAYQAKVQADRNYELAKEQLELSRQKLELKRYVALHRIPEGIYSINEDISSVTAFPSLRRATEEKEQPFAPLLQSPHPPPTEEYLLSHIRENSLTVSPGIRASSGDVVLVDMTQVPHGKLIGSSGFGKSTCMYIMLKQAAETNSPHRLQLALLDLEHKTSRLLEEYPHVATLRVGKRLVQLVATDADMVAEYLGYLKGELARRTQLSEAELLREPVLLIYVEEMLSLQYEVVDPHLVALIFQSLTILSVRGKKYGMLLYACMQTDYSTSELKVSQKMFRFRGAASVDVSAARAAGFQNTELVKHNFQHGKPGQMVIEYPSFSDLVLVPQVELKHLLARKTGFQDGFEPVPEHETPAEIPAVKPSRNTDEIGTKTIEPARKARFREVQQLREMGWGKVKILQKVYGAKPGTSQKYREAEAEYATILEQVEQEEQLTHQNTQETHQN